MALYWPSKAPGDVREYTWTPDADEHISSAVITVATGTATIDVVSNGTTITVTVTGGAVNVVQILAATVTFGNGEVLTEEIHIPVDEAGNRSGNTVRDVCLFALRKIVGNGDDPTADELSDAIERLQDFIASLEDQGANLGVPLPLAEGDVLFVRDSFLQGIKANLLIQVFEHYGEPVTALQYSMASRGLALIKNAALDRSGPDYF
ncbi:MAG: hypothetical protein ACRCYS_19670 [Beijerinckiaceae bacterium]